MKIVSITHMRGFIYVTIELKNGHRYWTAYTVEPTEAEVFEDFETNKDSFELIN